MSKVITPVFRVSFPNIFEPKGFEGQEPKYSIAMLFDESTDLSALKKAANEAAKKKWGDKIPKNMRSPFGDGNEKEFEGYQDHIVVNARTKNQPQVIDKNKQEILDPREFYAGCYARASIVAFAYDTAGNKGVAFALNNLQKMGEGEPLGNMARAVDEFDDESGSDDGEESIFG